MGRKNAIIEAATQLFAEKGFNETSTAEIAARAGVAHGTLFYHFKTKEGILLKVYETVMDSYLAGMRAAVAEASLGLAQIEEAVRFHFRFSAERAREILVLMRDFPAQLTAPDFPHRDVVTRKTAGVIALLRTCLEAGMADGSLRPLPAEETAHMVRGLMYGLSRQRLLGPLNVPEVDEEAIRFCHRALAAAPETLPKEL
jgi:AcrR family transcriptional regulator